MAAILHTFRLTSGETAMAAIRSRIPSRFCNSFAIRRNVRVHTGKCLRVSLSLFHGDSACCVL